MQGLFHWRHYVPGMFLDGTRRPSLASDRGELGGLDRYASLTATLTAMGW